MTAAVANRLGYTAREFRDASTVFYRARYYSPQVGRFLAEDPLRIEGVWTLPGEAAGFAARVLRPLLLRTPRAAWHYSYVSNQPILKFDPMGLAEAEVDRAQCTITFYDGQTCAPLGTFPASNNTTGTGNGLTPGCECPPPPGTYPVGSPVPTGEPPGSTGPFGPWFTPIYLPGGRRGVGVHSGRAHRGTEATTRGCIRTNDPGSQMFRDLQDLGDPVTLITIR